MWGKVLLSSNCTVTTHMSTVIYSGKMSAKYYMDKENLYVSFPKGITDGNTAHVVGTWTKDASGNKKAPLAMANYTCKYIMESEYLIVREGRYYRLKVVVLSSEKLKVRLQNDRGESESDESIVSLLD